jgi:nitrite reductase/ring-hydroxylating ferredoxin subunit
MARIRIAAVNDLEPGSVAAYAVAGRKIAVAFVDGGYYAFDDTCSHAEASLAEGRLDGFEIECPHHGARFDVRDGRFLTLPAVAPVRSYPVTVEQGGVFVEIES